MKKTKYFVIGLLAVGGIIFASQSEQSEIIKMQVSRMLPKHVAEMVRLEKLQNLTEQEAGDILPAVILDKNEMSRYFTIQEIDDKLMGRIDGKSYRENPNIGTEDLRYVKVLHYNFEHEIQVGELIVNEKIAEDCVKIFEELFAAEYEIKSMHLIDRYWDGDGVDADTSSVEDNNTSSFNYRVVPGSTSLSNHAKGLAVDVNPLQNPYVKYKADGSYAKYYKDMEKYIDRNSGKEHIITHEDLCYQVFRKYGFTWGGDWNSCKDYQHFEKVM